MGQQEIFNFIEKNPRLCTKEIARRLDYSLDRVSRLIGKLIKRGEVICDKPTGEELDRIKEQFPTVVTGIWNLRVFRIKNE